MIKYIFYVLLLIMFIKFIFAKLKDPMRPSGYASDYIERLMA
jgi:hypothetical protein